MTVSCITNTLNISFSELNAAMGKRGYLMSNGYGALKDVTFRIAHMGDNTIEDIDAMLSDLDEVIASFR